MKTLLSTDYIISEAEHEKASILNVILANDLNKNERYFTPKRIITTNNSETYINELYVEGYLEKPNLSIESLKLTKEGQKLLAAGGYILMNINKFQKEKEETELKSLNLKIMQKQLEQLQQQPQTLSVDLHKVLSTEEFEDLLKMPESTILDFKREMYDFANDTKGNVTADFVKDIISLSNAVRTETAHIIIGVEEDKDCKKTLLGLDNSIDDATLQEKVKNKVSPIPIFSFYKILYNEKNYGIISIPITKYDKPISSSVNLCSLVKGKYYYRQGTSNQEAPESVVFHIYDWLQQLPKNINTNKSALAFSDQIASLLKRATNNETKLSELITDALFVAKKNNLADLTKFCKYELQGITQNLVNSSGNFFDYRFERVVCSKGKVSLSPYRWKSATSNSIIQELRDGGSYFEYKMLFHFSITEIESHIADSENDKSAITINQKMKNLYPKWDKTDFEVTIFLFNDTFGRFYKKIRQELIELLIAF